MTINNLFPGPFETGRLRETSLQWSLQSGKTEDNEFSARRANNLAGRLGTPAEFGDACSHINIAKAGFIKGQNLLLDYGFYPGTF